MGAAVALRDIVGVTENIFLIRVVPLQSRLDDDAIPFGDDVEDFIKQRGLVFIKMLDERPDAPLEFKDVFAVGAFVKQLNAHPGIKERQFA